MSRPALNQLNHLNPLSKPDRLILLAVAALPPSFQHSKIIAHTDAWENVRSVTLRSLRSCLHAHDASIHNGVVDVIAICQQSLWVNSKQTPQGTSHSFVNSFVASESNMFSTNQWLDSNCQALLIFYLGVLIERQESRACGV